MTGFEPVTSSLPRKCSTPELHRQVWAKMDSNHRRHKPADLQSAPFGHSGIRPCNHIGYFLLSLLSDSNQRPRDYKSRALANWAKEAISIFSLSSPVGLNCGAKLMHIFQSTKLFHLFFWFYIHYFIPTPILWVNRLILLDILTIRCPTLRKLHYSISDELPP